jgi:hypothetical protein
MKKFVAIASSCALLPIAYVALGLDLWIGASRNILFELALVALGVVFGAYAFTMGGERVFLVLPTAYVLFILSLPFLELSPVKPAVRAVHEIRPGMSEAQVRNVLDHHFPQQGHFRRPAIGALHEDVLSFALDPTDGRYDAAVVQIRFSAGKCVAAEFSAD